MVKPHVRAVAYPGGGARGRPSPPLEGRLGKKSTGIKMKRKNMNEFLTKIHVYLKIIQIFLQKDRYIF